MNSVYTDNSSENSDVNAETLYGLCKKLFPICRSITGGGVRQILQIIKEIIPRLNTFEVPTGTKVFDWTVPKEWNIYDAYIIDPNGKKLLILKKIIFILWDILLLSKKSFR